ncbi:hypothetical protein GURASL_19320 [Geotalea uraniireducens]|uniref:Uncharacterized protein n=1 Tax=Geotalea uraniireducens TaxID=351604 RepID=A0ABM8EKD8_9BACT|nr:hypothetical protein [Geotalea uraniireducens]BDV43009.1 hypothetical protein GURASL_19320 [Geotalea uraniireducens]
MRYLFPTLSMLLILAAPLQAAELGSLAECTTLVFKEISRTKKWSGKPPIGCPGKVNVEKRAAGVFVTAWVTESGGEGWVMTAFSTAAGYGELVDKKSLARATSDVLARAGRLERCLQSLKSENDPGECRNRATKSYLVGEVTGTEHEQLIWLEDNGRHAVVEYSYGDTSDTPFPPADLFEENGEGGWSLTQ